MNRFFVLAQDGRIHAYASAQAVARAIETEQIEGAIRAVHDQHGIQYEIRRSPAQGHALEPVGPLDRASLLKAFEPDGGAPRDAGTRGDGWMVDLDELRLEVERDAENERSYGPVIAWGIDEGQGWVLRGRIAEDSAAYLLNGSGAKGSLPGQEGGPFGASSYACRSMGQAPTVRDVKGVVSKQTARVDVYLANGSTRSARIVDIGDPRASFFLCIWTEPAELKELVARDANGAELGPTRPARQHP